MLKAWLDTLHPRANNALRNETRAVSHAPAPAPAADTVAAPATQAPAPPIHPELAALQLPTVRKQNSPTHVDAPLKQDVLHEAAGAGSKRLQKFRTMTLHVEDGETFTASSHLYTGSFGAVSLAIDGMGQPWAVKVMRTRTKASSKTRVTKPADLEKELRFTRQYVSPEAFAGADGDGEIYMFLPLQALSAHQASRALADDPDTHAAVVRNVGAQVAQDLATMHADGNIMLDLKPGNIMIDANGRATMSDFGEATAVADMQAKIDDDTWELGGTELFASLESREAFVPQGKPIGSLPALDVWSLGMTLLDMTHPLQQGPFNGCTSLAGTMDTLRAYEAWRGRHMTPDGFDMNALQHPAGGTDPSEFTSYFQTIAARDPALCALLLNGVLVPTSSRIDAATVHTRLRALQPEDGDGAATANSALRQLGEGATAHAAVLAALQKRQDMGNLADAIAAPPTEPVMATPAPTPEPTTEPPAPATEAALTTAAAIAPTTVAAVRKKPVVLRVIELAGLSIRTYE